MHLFVTIVGPSVHRIRLIGGPVLLLRDATGSFTAALAVLKKAELLDSRDSWCNRVSNLAANGQEQERRRKQLERFDTEIDDALNHNNFVEACASAKEGLRRFPEDRSLLELRNLAEKQRQASEKRAYVEGQIAAARRLLDSADPDQSLVPLDESLTSCLASNEF